VGALGLAPSCPEGGCFTGNLGSVPSTLPWVIDGTRTRLLEALLRPEHRQSAVGPRHRQRADLADRAVQPLARRDRQARDTGRATAPLGSAHRRSPRTPSISRCAPVGTRSALSSGACQHPHRHCSSVVTGRRCVRAACGHTYRESRYGVIDSTARSQNESCRMRSTRDAGGAGALCAATARNVEGPPGFPGSPSARVID
jgi:hypothetical protein